MYELDTEIGFDFEASVLSSETSDEADALRRKVADPERDEAAGSGLRRELTRGGATRHEIDRSARSPRFDVHTPAFESHA